MEIKGSGDTESIVRAIHKIARRISRPVRLMEVCGTHTVAVFRHGIRGLLPDNIKLLSGPGCPVCVTSIKDVDVAIAIAKRPECLLVTFGDMMRVPGGRDSLYSARAHGAGVEIVYSPLDALDMASKAPDKKVVFFAAGFETTAPLIAATLIKAEKEGVDNFFLYSVHKLVPPALRALIGSGDVMVDGLILPGHVSAIIGSRPYEFLAAEFAIPSVVTGFDPMDILEGILLLLRQIGEGKPSVEIQYSSVVREEGNPRALSAIAECFEPEDADWRGIGRIPESGLSLKGKYARRNIIEELGGLEVPDYGEPRNCSCGEVLRGIKAPTECPLFGKSCTPEKPVGACMVSTEGSCAAYYRYGGGNLIKPEITDKKAEESIE